MAEHSHSHIMSDDQWSGWLDARARLEREEPVDPKTSSSADDKKPKQTPALLSQLLLQAASEGNAESVRDLLAKGANPNARERPNPRRSALLVAIEGGFPVPALEIMRAGGWCAPSQWGRSNSSSRAFDAAVAAGPLSGALLAEAIGRSIVLFFNQRCSWTHLEQAANICKAALPHGESMAVSLMGEAVSRGRWDMAIDALAAGEPLHKDSWALAERHLSAFGSAGQRRLKSLLSFATHPQIFEAMPPTAAQALFSTALHRNSADLLVGLLNARLRPSADWLVPSACVGALLNRVAPSSARSASIPFVVACAISPENAPLFKIASSIPSALEAARTIKASPWVLEAIPLAGLQQLHALGIPLDGVDSNGMGIFHVWAAVDPSPRSGWATLGRLLPESLALLNAKGCSASQEMAGRLSGKDAQDFLASLARMESREIRQSAGPVPAKPSAPKSRPRL